MENIKEILQQAENDVYIAITLGVAICHDQIEFSAEDLLEIYYILWHWKQRLGMKVPQAVDKLLNIFAEATKEVREEVDLFIAAKEFDRKHHESSEAEENIATPTVKKTSSDNEQKIFYTFIQPGSLPS